MAATSTERLISQVISKLDDMPLSFDDEQADIESRVSASIIDALRDIGVGVDGIEQNSKLELYVELRATWWTLFRYKNSSAVYFKYGTGTNDGKIVDKTMITKAIGDIMDELDMQYQQYKPNVTGMVGGIWNIARRESTKLR